MKKLSKLKWLDWLLVLATVMLLSPIAIYTYSVLIFGEIGWNKAQIDIAKNMGFIWIVMSMYYIVVRLYGGLSDE